MKFIGDFHIHSHYSRATSKFLTPEHLDYWARLKGIKVVGTGDCQHPGWFDELSKKLEKCPNGLYRLKKEYKLELPVPKQSILNEQEVYFVPTTEISNIYKKYDKVRKVHNVCIFPDLDVVKWFQEKLDLIGNIRSDGRPILGLDSKDLLAITLESSESSIFIPAHIWTPWFSALGSKSGFDSIEECFGDLTPHIHAVETGLSSDPPMNRICSMLDKFLLISNSDAHSPDKLGREANLFDTELSYAHIHKALQTGEGFVGTVEFYPQEGKYHYDGHRKCKTFWNPLETIENGSICPVCGHEVTKGVMYRVAELADRKTPLSTDDTSFTSLTPLPELLSEIVGVGPKSKRVQKEYIDTLSTLGSEFDIMLNTDLSEIKSKKNELFAEGVRRLRAGEVNVTEGFDGVFGTVKVFNKGETLSHASSGLFGIGFETHPSKKDSVEFDVTKFQTLKSATLLASNQKTQPPAKTSTKKKQTASEKQAKKRQASIKKAIITSEGHSLVLAGPGTGKTWLLHQRIQHVLAKSNDAKMLALTFSNAASDAIQSRLNDQVDTALQSAVSSNVHITTFHKFGLEIIKKYGHFVGLHTVNICDESEIANALNKQTTYNLNKTQVKAYLSEASQHKKGIQIEKPDLFDEIEHWKREQGLIDLDDLVYLPLLITENNKFVEHDLIHAYTHILIDECQDLNLSQYKLATLFAKNPSVQFMFIGDPDQSIYSFQGSSTDILDQAKTALPKATIFSLEESFRCPQPILTIASQVLNKTKPLNGKASSLSIDIHHFESDVTEAKSIAAYISKELGGLDLVSIDQKGSESFSDPTIDFSDIAILCRTSLQFDTIAKALESAQIPVKIIKNQSYLSEEPFSSIITALKQGLQQESFQSISCVDAVKNSYPDIESLPTSTAKNFLSLAKTFGSDISGFLEHIMLRLPQDEQLETNAVHLMTMHAAKGLEFDTIIMPGCEEKLLPFQVFEPTTPQKTAEEERLFYVGLTRTKRKLFLSYADKRKLKHLSFQSKPSQFLNKFEHELIKLKKQKKRKKVKQIEMF